MSMSKCPASCPMVLRSKPGFESKRAACFSFRRIFLLTASRPPRICSPGNSSISSQSKSNPNLLDDLLHRHWKPDGDAVLGFVLSNPLGGHAVDGFGAQVLQVAFHSD